ncbi:hypothetical protein PR048_012064 [Dryococelus australis]|uniref:Uncharacterized protein n=1 Tax=Dryococelus australis TaxID=614101 RepID=A0ABQ9HND6_9NEOP|nr:hypothetical protein PR048_012064 [Dryococelus australis]
MELVEEIDEVEESMTCKQPKKHLKLGRLSDVNNMLLAQTHELGPPCHCTRIKCFENITVKDRKPIIAEFNNVNDYNEQNKYLGGLITSAVIKRHRLRNKKNDSNNLHSYSYYFKVRMPVCYKAFISLHGITPRRVQKPQTICPFGNHNNRPHKLSDDTMKNIRTHIQSLRGRISLYSLCDTNVKKLHDIFNEKYPTTNVSYSSYRAVFVTKYTISFGYPRTDTCSTCDEYNINEWHMKKNTRRP